MADLVTVADVKTALNIPGSGEDARLALLVTQTSAEVEKFCRRVFAQSTLTEYPRLQGTQAEYISLARPPVTKPITSLYISTALPRVYDASTLLVEGTDFFVDSDSGVIRLVHPVAAAVLDEAAKVVYQGGFATIPADLARAVVELIAAKLVKGREKQYHLASTTSPEGAVGGIRFDDLTPDAERILESYRLPLAA